MRGIVVALIAVGAAGADTRLDPSDMRNQKAGGYDGIPSSSWWSTLSNPVFQRPDWSVKDATMGYDPGSNRFLLAFSAFYNDTAPGSSTLTTISHVVGFLTTNFSSLSGPTFVISGHDAGWIGMCSPNLTPLPQSANHSFVLTFNSWGDEAGKPNQLFFMTSTDLAHWQALPADARPAEPPYHPLAPTLTSGSRSIDAAVTFWEEQQVWVLAYKNAQGTLAVATSEALDGEFQPVSGVSMQPNVLAEHENFEFVVGPDGNMRLVSSDYGVGITGPRNTWIYTQADASSFAQWTHGYATNISAQWFNTNDLANAGYVADFRAVPADLGDPTGPAFGAYVLLYAGNQNDQGWAGRGHNRLGMARSVDLVSWQELPPSAP